MATLSITTEHELSAWLEHLGFVTESVEVSTRQITFEKQSATERSKVICRTIEASTNSLDTHIIVSVEDGEFRLYFYEDVNYRFQFWEAVAGDAPDVVLQDSIMTASSLEAIRRRYPVLR